jgi:phosphoribosylanthranilate isomerase
MFTIKICGITNVDDAATTVAAGADAIGLNFYPPSPRYIDRARAKEIAAAVGSQVCKVGLFVNASVESICETYDDVGLDLIQLHGDERPEILRSLAPRPVMKAFRLGPDGLAPVRRWLEDAMRLSLSPRMVLLDAYQPGVYGGTGRTTEWPLAAVYAATSGMLPLVLAGGLTSENVGQAITTVRPKAVDTAGGVESEPGRKDAARVRAFVAAAKAGFAAF